jgi:hypothetical protein
VLYRERRSTFSPPRQENDARGVKEASELGISLGFATKRWPDPEQWARLARVMQAIAATTASGIVTPDLGGTATTRQTGDAILSHL